MGRSNCTALLTLTCDGILNMKKVGYNYFLFEKCVSGEVFYFSRRYSNSRNKYLM